MLRDKPLDILEAGDDPFLARGQPDLPRGLGERVEFVVAGLELGVGVVQVRIGAVEGGATGEAAEPPPLLLQDWGLSDPLEGPASSRGRGVCGV